MRKKNMKRLLEVRGHNGNNVHTKTHTITYQGHKWATKGKTYEVHQEGPCLICQHTCSFWANAVGLVSARSGSRYCRGSSRSDSLSNRGMASAGAGASTGPWLEGYRGTRRSRQRARRRAGVSMAKQALCKCLSGSIGS